MHVCSPLQEASFMHEVCHDIKQFLVVVPDTGGVPSADINMYTLHDQMGA